MIQVPPKYSFVMPAYKAQFIYEAVESVLKQTLPDFELIIVDDNSPEHLDVILSKFNDSRIRYYKNQQNIGGKDLVAQWNHSLKYSTGKWIILATDDDVYDLNFLKKADELLNKYPTSNIFRARVAICDAHGSVYAIEPCMPERTTKDELLYSMFNGLYGGVPQYVINKNKLDEIGGFLSYPKAWGSDDYTALLLSDNGIIFSDEVLLKFRMSSINISSQIYDVEEKLKARILYYKNLYDELISKWIIQVQENTIYKSRIVMQYKMWFWKDMLMYLHMIPFYQRYKLFPMIASNTPYFTLKEKRKLFFRAYLKKIRINMA